MEAKKPFPVISDLDFCPQCGCILPMMSITASSVDCNRCSFKRNTNEYTELVEEFTIHFNTSQKGKRKEQANAENAAEDDEEEKTKFSGPTVDRHCPRCNHDTMIYTTRQTRSADEGQTVFYTCVKCKFQDIEYS